VACTSVIIMTTTVYGHNQSITTQRCRTGSDHQQAAGVVSVNGTRRVRKLGVRIPSLLVFNAGVSDQCSTTLLCLILFCPSGSDRARIQTAIPCYPTVIPHILLPFVLVFAYSFYFPSSRKRDGKDTTTHDTQTVRWCLRTKVINEEL